MPGLRKRLFAPPPPSSFLSPRLGTLATSEARFFPPPGHIFGRSGKPAKLPHFLLFKNGGRGIEDGFFGFLLSALYQTWTIVWEAARTSQKTEGGPFSLPPSFRPPLSLLYLCRRRPQPLSPFPVPKGREGPSHTPTKPLSPTKEGKESAAESVGVFCTSTEVQRGGRKSSSPNEHHYRQRGRVAATVAVLLYHEWLLSLFTFLHFTLLEPRRSVCSLLECAGLKKKSLSRRIR